MNVETKSYAEIAEILTEFGISGITDEMVKELEKNDAELSVDVIFDKTATMLSVLGNGTMNYDTWEWTPSENGVYSFDMEVFDEGNMYRNFLLGVSSLGGDELIFKNIQEDTSDIDWESGEGTRIVSFEWNGIAYTLEAEAMGDWFDLKLMEELNQIIIESGNEKHLFFASDGYQECIVFYCDADWARSFQKATGLELSDKGIGTSGEEIPDSPTDMEMETVVYETVADVTHDGTDDLIRLAAYNANSYANVNQLLESVTSVSYVKVYRGLENGKFEMSSPVYTSRGFSMAHTGNGTVCLSQKDGYDYLLFSNINEAQGYANYSYEVVYISEEDETITEDSDVVDFAVSEAPHIDWENEPHREDVVPEFRENIAPWIEKAVVIVSLSIDSGVLVSTEEKENTGI